MIQFYPPKDTPSKTVLNLKKLFSHPTKNSFKLGFIILLVIFMMKNEMRFELNFNSAKSQLANDETTERFSILQPFSRFFESDKSDNQKQANISAEGNLSNDYSNMTYESTTKASRGNSLSKVKKQQNYIQRFSAVAKSEMKKYGIPASITLAQGLIESNAGESRLSKENNNHFGMKCFSKTCKKGHCANFTDDSHKDFFRKYETAWESYRSHSLMLGGNRYKHLKKLSKSDYKGWATGLQKAGYATDKRYAKKLIHIIEEMELHRYDY